ncbi:hypothetical protein ACQ859_19515 [Roseateles chitinivorans]|uniref:hypothetical protein n=1 Tax=Roseateles chitinivorans TaxID=2917965 RepID=UPI003D679542
MPPSIFAPRLPRRAAAGLFASFWLAALSAPALAVEETLSIPAGWSVGDRATFRLLGMSSAMLGGQDKRAEELSAEVLRREDGRWIHRWRRSVAVASDGDDPRPTTRTSATSQDDNALILHAFLKAPFDVAVDDEGRLIGIVNQDDLLAASRQIAAELLARPDLSDARRDAVRRSLEQAADAEGPWSRWLLELLRHAYQRAGHSFIAGTTTTDTAPVSFALFGQHVPVSRTVTTDAPDDTSAFKVTVDQTVPPEQMHTVLGPVLQQLRKQLGLGPEGSPRGPDDVVDVSSLHYQVKDDYRLRAGQPWPLEVDHQRTAMLKIGEAWVPVHITAVLVRRVDVNATARPPSPGSTSPATSPPASPAGR